MNTLQLPKIMGDKPQPVLPKARQLSIIGGSGAGKTKFMERLMELTGKRTFCLSAVGAPFPEREVNLREGSIDQLFYESARKRPYMRTDAVSELEKLTYMLFTDEFEYLMRIKEESSDVSSTLLNKKTRLDKLADIWEMVFPGHKIVRSKGNLLFSTEAGEDLIPIDNLSQGEKAVLYYVAGVLYAMKNAVVFVDAPSLFLHPTVLKALWNSIEELRPDCTFVYNSVDVEFVSSRSENVILWVKSYNASLQEWDYEILESGEINEDIFIELVGSRKPVLFIEGDLTHSIDARLYPLVFPDYTVKPLGSCDKVIETTRSFNGIKNMHHLESHGLVDRDRRTDLEVEYLRKKSIMVPDVAEVENLFLLEEVIKAMALKNRKNPESVFRIVKKNSFKEFNHHMQQQVMQHVRHRMKREVESKIDAKFTCITALESHLRKLINLLNPRKHYNELNRSFDVIIESGDYSSMLKVFNHKPLLSDCGVADLLGFKNKNEYVNAVIETLKEGSEFSERIRNAIRKSLRVGIPPEPSVDQNIIPSMVYRRPQHRRNKKRRNRILTR